MKELQDILREARSLPNEFTALATVVRTAGSRYRRPGARLLVPQDGKSIGAISGGCFGGEVVLRGELFSIPAQRSLLHSILARSSATTD